MKRFSFLAVLFGFCAAAQDHRWSFQTDQNGNIETRLVSGPARPRLARGKLRWFSGAPLNNQCPICGTMAEPYRPQPSRYCADSAVMQLDGTLVSGCEFEAKMSGRNLARCRHCNAAFWQDAEAAGK